jgi:hypothetical protein
MQADQIPVARTPPGGYGPEMPPPILAGCTEPLVAGVPGFEVTRRLDGDQLVWGYGPMFTARLERVG